MKSPIIQTIAIVVLAVATGPFIYFEAIAADSQDPAAEFAKLEKSGNENAQDWLQLAASARRGDDLVIAGKALQIAVGHGLSPIQAGMEKTRILVK